MNELEKAYEDKNVKNYGHNYPTNRESQESPADAEPELQPENTPIIGNPEN